jgi:hypothetical protein
VENSHLACTMAGAVLASVFTVSAMTAFSPDLLRPDAGAGENGLWNRGKLLVRGDLARPSR